MNEEWKVEMDYHYSKATITIYVTSQWVNTVTKKENMCIALNM